MATRDDKEGARFTRDNLDKTAQSLKHDLTWALAPDSNRKGHAYYFIGTCGNCGGNAHAAALWSSTSSVVDVRTATCGGPGTWILTEIEQARASERAVLAIAAYADTVRRIVAGMN